MPDIPGMTVFDPHGRAGAEGAAASASVHRRTGLRIAAAVSAIAAVTIVVVAVVASRSPEFYRQRLTMATAEASARRLVSDAAALHASIVREGPWEAAFTENDINAWLAVDLPRNHGRLLPDWLAEPRVRLEPRRVQLAVRVGHGLASAVAAVTAEVVLREPNQLGIVVEDAHLGGLPLPRGPVLTELRRRCDQLGMVTSVRRLDDRSLLVVYIPSTHESGGMSHWLETLTLGDGSIAITGQTRAGRAALGPTVTEGG
jgi:hypothetical protein